MEAKGFSTLIIYLAPFVVFPFTAQIQYELNKGPADTDHLTVGPTPQTNHTGRTSNGLDAKLYLKTERK